MLHVRSLDAVLPPGVIPMLRRPSAPQALLQVAVVSLIAGLCAQAFAGDVRMALVADDRTLADLARDQLPGGDVIGGIWILPELRVANPAGGEDGLAEPRRLAEGGGFTHMVVLEHRVDISWRPPRVDGLDPFVAHIARVVLQTRRIETRLDVHLFDIATGRILTWYTQRREYSVPLALALWVRDPAVVSRQLHELLSGAADAVAGVLPDSLTPPAALEAPLTVERIRSDPYWNSVPPAEGVPPGSQARSSAPGTAGSISRATGTSSGGGTPWRRTSPSTPTRCGSHATGNPPGSGATSSGRSTTRGSPRCSSSITSATT